MALHYLVDVPHIIPTAARWYYQQWPALFQDEADAIEELKQVQHRDQIPLCLVEMEKDEVLGTAALLTQDMDTYAQHSPWLACVYVSEAYRGQGIGKKVVLAATDKARQLGVEKLYLWTDHQKKFYEKLGWQTLATTIYKTYPVTVMSLDL